MLQSIMILPHLSRHNYFVIRKELKNKNKNREALKKVIIKVLEYITHFSNCLRKNRNLFSRGKSSVWFPVTELPAGVWLITEEWAHSCTGQISDGVTSFSVICNKATWHKNARCQMYCYYCLNMWLNRKALNRIHPFEITFNEIHSCTRRK